MTRTAFAAAALLLAASALAQQSAAPPPAPPLIQWEKIEIKTTDLGQNTYMLEGQGGNITVAIGTEGILMVDSQFAPLSDKIKNAIRAISPLPIKYLVNTHFHGDHTGGNENFAKDGVVIVAHDNIRVRLAAGTTGGLTGVRAPPRPPEALPQQTYFGGTLTLEVGGRTGRLTHVANAHTDGDTWVYFADANVLATGDTMKTMTTLSRPGAERTPLPSSSQMSFSSFPTIRYGAAYAEVASDAAAERVSNPNPSRIAESSHSFGCLEKVLPGTT
jgi:cyclase